MQVNAVELVLRAKKELRLHYGACAASNPSLVHVTAERLIADRDADASGRLMIEVGSLLGTGTLSTSTSND